MLCGVLRTSRILIFSIFTPLVETIYSQAYVQFNFILLNTSELATCIACHHVT